MSILWVNGRRLVVGVDFRPAPFLDLRVLAPDGLPKIVTCYTFNGPANKGRCWHCGGPFPDTRHRTYCRPECAFHRLIHHNWQFARSEAINRWTRAGQACAGCLAVHPRSDAALPSTGRLDQLDLSVFPEGWRRWARQKSLERGWLAFVGPEVHHLRPLKRQPGRNDNESCLHHQANLEVLCPVCHLVKTAEQRALGLIGLPKPPAAPALPFA